MPASSTSKPSRLFLVLVLLGLFCTLGRAADNKPTAAQRRAAEEFLAAIASGDPQAVAFAIHPAELDALRQRILKQMRDEATRNDNTLRIRLFGLGMPLAELERMTSVGFYTTLARKLYLTGREFRDVEGLVAIPDKDGAVWVVVSGKPPKERGTVSVPALVLVKPYGKDWKAVVQPEIEAQIEDIAQGRRGLMSVRPAPQTGAKPSGTSEAPAESGAPPAMTELISSAEKALADGNCDDYYNKYMSPSFRRVTSKKAREALIAACKNNSTTRNMLVATLRIVAGLTPRFEYEGARAVYDLSGQGLPYDRFVLEQVDKRWYIAE